MIEKVAIASKLFHTFERENHLQIESLKHRNLILWQIIKIPLYFHIIKGVGGTEEQNEGRVFRIIKAGFKFWIGIIFLKRNQNLLFRSSIHSRTKDQTLSHVIFGMITKEKLVKDLYSLDLYAGNEGKFKFPRAASIRINHLFHTSKILRSFLLTTTDLKENISSMTKLLNEHFDKHEFKFQVNEAYLEAIVKNFRSEYLIFKWFYKLIQPNTLLLVDGFSTANMIAAKHLGVKVLEFQHGLFDEYYPHYTYAKELSHLKDGMVLPDKIIVFGEFFKNLLMRCEFWDDNEIFVLGKPGIEKVDVTSSIGRQMILHPTQGEISFSRTRKLLDHFISMPRFGAKIIIKPHPQETKANFHYFKKLAEEYPNLIETLSENEDIIDSFKRANLIIGFDSTSLLESVALGIPTVSLRSMNLPKGIISLVNSDRLADAIRILENDSNEIYNLITMFERDENFRQEWENRCRLIGNYLFNREYKANIKQLASEINC